MKLKAETKGAEKNVTLQTQRWTDAEKADEKTSKAIDNAQARDVDAQNNFLVNEN